MEAATVTRGSGAAAPARVPRDRPRPKAVPRSRPKAAPRTKAAPRAKAQPARAPRTIPKPTRVPRKRQAPARRPGGQLIPIAVGTAAAVRSLPDSGLVVRMTRGRLWIGVLGVLLAGIVGLNVVTLSLAASTGHVEENIQALEKENTMLSSRDAQRSGVARVRHDAAAIGLATPRVNEIAAIHATRGDAAVAAQRLAAAGP
jgi:hypothetical protein